MSKITAENQHRKRTVKVSKHTDRLAQDNGYVYFQKKNRKPHREGYESGIGKKSLKIKFLLLLAHNSRTVYEIDNIINNHAVGAVEYTLGTKYCIGKRQCHKAYIAVNGCKFINCIVFMLALSEKRQVDYYSYNMCCGCNGKGYEKFLYGVLIHLNLYKGVYESTRHYDVKKEIYRCSCGFLGVYPLFIAYKPDKYHNEEN